jgi:hypothetical protein
MGVNYGGSHPYGANFSCSIGLGRDQWLAVVVDDCRRLDHRDSEQELGYLQLRPGHADCRGNRGKRGGDVADIFHNGLAGRIGGNNEICLYDYRIGAFPGGLRRFAGTGK